MTLKKNEPLLSGNLIREAAKESLKKLSPKAQAKNPVMLIVYLGSIFTGALFISDLLHGTAATQTSLLAHGVAMVYGAFCQFCRKSG